MINMWQDRNPCLHIHSTLRCHPFNLILFLNQTSVARIIMILKIQEL